MTAHDWRDDARCRELGPDLFHPGRGERVQEDEAKAVCRQCSVMGECLSYALEQREPMGVWGGKTTRERERLLGKRVRIKAAGHAERRRAG